MKLPSLKVCLMACVARICGPGSDQQPPQAFTNKPRPFFSPPKKQIVAKDLRPTSRYGSNQRQVRKDRRRANAAGKRNAFA